MFLFELIFNFFCSEVFICYDTNDFSLQSLDFEDDSNKNNDHDSDEKSELTDEVLGLPTNCYACNASCVTNMKLTHILFDKILFIFFLKLFFK